MSDGTLRVLVTGANGFVGRNLTLRLKELKTFTVLPVGRDTDDAELADMVLQADAVVHLAGVNRPPSPDDFMAGNRDVTQRIVALLRGRALPVWYASSTQAAAENAYGASKKSAEDVLFEYGRDANAVVSIARLPNIFGKWARPNYNSAVATFCHNIARGLPISVNDPAAPLTLVYIDDVVASIVAWLGRPDASGYVDVAPSYQTTVGELADNIRTFRADRDTHMIESVGQGLIRALYATYVSYLPLAEFSYPLISHGDERGVFSEMLKTRTSGQFSYFTAHPGVTRGGHYHHTKTEKFLVVRGKARFQFRHMLTGERHSIDTDGDTPQVVETVPGWTHDITNIGDDLLVSMLWANEVFDPAEPDTIAEKV